MKFDLMPIKKGETDRLNLNFTINLDNISYYGDILKFVEPVHVSGEIYSIGNQLFLEGEIETKIEAKCSRCLKPFTYDLNTSVRVELVREDQQKDTEFIEDAYFYSSNMLDMEEIVNDAVLTNIPMKGLCNEECRGLCSGCGKDLNDGACDCILYKQEKPYDSDPRLSKLKKLLLED